MALEGLSSRILLLALLGRINPAVFDVIPRAGQRVGEAVALSAQPSAAHDRVVVGAAALAERLAQLAIKSSTRGEGVGFLAEEIDDWCGTPWPRKWPWPGPGPRPGGDGPLPEWDIAVGRAVAAVTFATFAAKLGDGELQAEFARSAEKLADAAVGGR